MTRRAYVRCTWDDAPHLDEKTKREMYAALEPHLRDARSKGIPTMGAGAIYPIALENIVVDPFKIPAHWPRAYGLDVGWNKTAAVWGAWDPMDETLHLVAEYYMGQKEPAVHAQAIKMRGDWIPGVIDPASDQANQKDGERLLTLYQANGLKLKPADNAREAGIYKVFTLMSQGRLKVFSTLRNWASEFRNYHRDENGRVVKERDHCLHGNTRVVTSNGPRRIANLVGTSGWVATSGGEYAAYCNVRQYGHAEPVVRLDFADGSSVVSTPDHRFLTPHGWVEAASMEGELCVSSSSQKPSKSTKGSDTTDAANTSRETAFGCIGQSGRIGTGQSLKGITSIMWTTIKRTMRLTICHYLPRLSIYRTTSLDILGPSLKGRAPKRPNGMRHQRDANGIASIMSASKTLFTGLLNTNVSNVERALRHTLGLQFVFVPTLADLHGDETAASTTKVEHVSCVKRLSLQTSTAKSGRAHEPALVRCLAVRSAGRADTYCMTVPETGCFAVETGHIVHNCMDAMRYLVMSGRAVAKPIPVPKNSPMVAPGTIDQTAGY